MAHHEEHVMPDEKKSIAPSTLSKSWSVASAHVPTFTGGKVTHCHTQGLLQTTTGERVEFLVLPVAGDVALVDAHRGTKIRTLRQGMEGVVSETLNDDEDDGMDADAITCYALSHDDEMLITVSQNHLIRQYHLAAAFSWNESKPAPILKTWGKSGHKLPVTHVEFHISNVFVATGSVDGSVRIWDVRGGYVTHVFRPMMQGDDNGGMHAVSAISWKQDSTQLVIAIGREDGTMVVHDLRQEDNVIVMRDHVSAVTCMEWSATQQAHLCIGRSRCCTQYLENHRDCQQEEKEARRRRSKVCLSENTHASHLRTGRGNGDCEFGRIKSLGRHCG